jgi:DNA-binding beta-propeller fold protein YncE
LAVLASLQQQTPPKAPDNSYLFFVASEGFNQVALVRFGPAGARIEHRTLIRLPSIDSANPRSLRVAPGGQDYYLATALGFPTGELLKLRIAADSAPMLRFGADSARGAAPADTLRGREPLDTDPGAIQVTPDGTFAWITNATPAADPQLSSISVVYLKPMVEVARIATCASPRGGRLTADGTRHYSVCLHDDALVDIDARAMKVARRLALAGAGEQRCGPSWVTTSADDTRLYVTCEQSGEVIEIDARAWAVTRRIAVGKEPGDVAATADGRMLVVTNRGSQNVSLVDLAGGHEVAQVPMVLHFPATFAISPADEFSFVTAAWEVAQLSVRRVPAGVVVSPDNRYAFVTVSGIGGDPGTVDVIDLADRVIVATIEVGRGARGIDFWKMEAKKTR